MKMPKPDKHQILTDDELKGLTTQERQAVARFRSIELGDLNEENRTVTMSFASEAPVMDWWGEAEILRCTDEAMDTSRFDGGVMPILFNHDRDQCIGFPQRIWCEGAKAYAEIKFANTDKANEVMQLVKDGLRGVSVGYRVLEWTVIEEGAKSTDGIAGPAWIAERWEVFEISIVTVPADATVGVGRSLQYIKAVEKPGKNESEERTMGENEKVLLEAQKVERERCAAINALCEKFTIDSEKRDAWINAGTDVATVNRELLEVLAERNKPVNAGVVAVEAGEAETEKLQRAYTDALCLRFGVRKDKYADGAEQLRGMSQKDIARDLLIRAGEHKVMQMDPETLMKRALTTGGFAGILDAVVRAAVSQGYTEAATTYQEWAQIGSLPDFKETKRVQLNAGVEPEKILENGEFTYADFAANGVGVKLDTEGIAWRYTRQCFINDDLDILTKIPAREAAAFARKINTMVYTALAAVAKGVTGEGVTTNTVNEARKYLRRQTFKDGNKKKDVNLNLLPTHIIVPPEYELAAYQMLNSTADPSGANSGVANGFRNTMKPVCDANLSADAWFMLAGNNQVDTIEVNFLNGNRNPIIEAQDEFNVLARSYRMYLDFAVMTLDTTGICKVSK